MQQIIKSLIVMFLVGLSLSKPISAETVDVDQLYELDGLTYQRFATEPFNGVATDYIDKQKTKIFRNEKYVNGRIVYEESFCVNGRLKYKRNLISKYKLADGNHIIFDCDGNIRKRWTVKNGVEDGAFERFYENGNLKTVDHYSEGTIIKSEFFDKYGRLKTVNEFTNDNGDGRTISYYLDGQIKSKGQLKNGKEDGVTTTYDIKGEVDERHFYSNGTLLKPLIVPIALKGFPICKILSSKGQFCKSLEKDKRDVYSLNEYKAYQKRYWSDQIASIETVDWRYGIEVVENGNKTQIQFTDEALTATYYTVVTYDIEFSESDRNWFLIGSVVDDLRGSEDDRKVIGKYRKYDPPIPFLEINE